MWTDVVLVADCRNCGLWLWFLRRRRLQFVALSGGGDNVLSKNRLATAYKGREGYHVVGGGYT